MLCNLGTSSLHLGRQGTAVDYLERAVAIFGEVGDQNGQASALNGLGEAAGVAGDPGRALAHYTAAAALAADIGETYQHARAHIGLGHAHHRLGDLTQAGQHRQRALELYTGYEGPEADRLRALVSSPTPTLSP